MYIENIYFHFLFLILFIQYFVVFTSDIFCHFIPFDSVPNKVCAGLWGNISPPALYWFGNRAFPFRMHHSLIGWLNCINSDKDYHKNYISTHFNSCVSSILSPVDSEMGLANLTIGEYRQPSCAQIQRKQTTKTKMEHHSTTKLSRWTWTDKNKSAQTTWVMI